MKKIVIVGGRPAGMMASIRASQFTSNVILIEKNDILDKKLLLTGNGRCSFTNSNYKIVGTAIYLPVFSVEIC